MGWSSANQIFDPVASAVLMASIDDSFDSIRILEVLIKALQEGDWDTEDESLYFFRGQPEVVEAFKRCGIPMEDEEQ